MKLLFDENMSPKLAQLLRDKYPGSVHVRDAGLQGAADHQICEYAGDRGFVIVSKDDDFRQRSFLQRAPTEGHLASGWQRRHGCDCGAAAGRRRTASCVRG